MKGNVNIKMFQMTIIANNIENINNILAWI